MGVCQEIHRFKYVFDFSSNFEIGLCTFEACISQKPSHFILFGTSSTNRPCSRTFSRQIRDYATKKAAAGGKLVDATPETEAALQSDLDRVAKLYGGGQGVDMTKFPDMTWSDAELQSLELGSK